MADRDQRLGASDLNRKCRIRKGFDMNTKKGYLSITLVLSIVPVIVGMLMVIFSNGAYEKTVGLAMTVIGPAVIWGFMGAHFLFVRAFSVLKGFTDKPCLLPGQFNWLARPWTISQAIYAFGIKSMNPIKALPLFQSDSFRYLGHSVSQNYYLHS